MRLFLALVIVITACNSSPAPAEPAAINSTSPSASSNTTNTKQPAADSTIAAIRSEYGRINALKPDSSRYSFMCDEQATVIVFKEKGSVVKAVIDWGWVGDATTREEWYYKDGKLFFRYVRSEGAAANQPKTTVHEARTYVKDDKVIRYLQDSREVPCESCKFTAASKEYALLKATNNEEMKMALCR